MPAGNREAQGCRTGDSRGQVSGVFLAVSVALGIYFLASLSILSVEYSVILLIALLVFFIAFLRTDFALYILIFSMLFSPEIGLGRIPGREIAVRVEDLFIIVIFFGWMAKMAITKNLAFIKKSVLNPPIFLYIFACFLSTLLGLLAGELSLRSSFFYLFKYLEYFLLYFMVINNLRDERQAKIYVGLILITCLLVSVYGLFQIPSGQRVTAPFEGKEGGEPNTFAGYLLMMMALIISLIQNIPFKKQGFWLLGFLGLTLYIFVNTGSRGAWLGFFPMLAVFIFLNKRHRFPLLLVTATFLLLLPFIMPQKMQARIKETFNPEKSVSVFGSQVTIAESAAARVDSWKTAMP
ncbi:MAG: O-antigen ligase family protein, partial [Deltaproteobacteria bacterium]